MGQRGFHQEEHAEDVGLERADDLLFGQIENALARCLLTGVVHKHVDAAPLSYDAVDHAAAEFLVAHIAFEYERVPTELPDALGNALSVVVGRVVRDGHVSALFREGDGHGGPDAAVSSGNESSPTLKLA